MLKRTGFALFGLTLLLPAVGCVEAKQTITLNPDGSGKVHYDVLMPGQMDLSGQPNQNQSLEDQKLKTVTKILTDPKSGVAAWKDVSAEWKEDGRLHFVGTAYFEQLDKVKNESLMSPAFQVGKDKNGAWLLTAKVKDQKKQPMGEPKPLPDPSKLSDKELDEHILKFRIGYQQAKGIYVAMFSDWKCKTTFHLPGKASDPKGFKKESDKVVSQDVDGATLVKGIQQLMAKDNAFFRKKIRDSGSLKLIDLNGDEFFGQFVPVAELKIDKPGGNEFDFAKEVKLARDAYPMLRTKLNLDKNKKLPGE